MNTTTSELVTASLCPPGLEDNIPHESSSADQSLDCAEIGHKFGQLTVVRRTGNDAAGKIRLVCACECGNPIPSIVRRSDLRNGHTKSCGCLRAKAIQRRFPKIQLKRFGTLAVLGKTEPVHETRATTKWLTFCDLCNDCVIATTYQLRALKKYCPCLKPTHQSWRNMIQRCTNPNHDQYQDYGGRGINVCERWRNSFMNFLDDMGSRPQGKTLDRVNNDGLYSPDNCRWAAPKEQARGRRKPERSGDVRFGERSFGRRTAIASVRAHVTENEGPSDLY